jgi:tol-pal system protein YbgF
MNTALRLPRLGLKGVLAAGLLSALLPAQAQLFGGDDEARRAIIELRARVESHRQAHAEADARLERELKALSEDELTPLRRGVLDLVNQVEGLRRELAELRGHNERLTHQVAELQKQQRDVLGALDERRRPLDPVQVSLDGVQFSARPDEVQAFEQAMAALRASDFAGAARLYQALITQFPRSGYVPSALYWQGNAHYAARNYAAAIDSYQRLIQQAPSHARAPEAMLAIANCHLELKDARAARTVLQDLLKRYPDTEAGVAARERLARLR